MQPGEDDGEKRNGRVAWPAFGNEHGQPVASGQAVLLKVLPPFAALKGSRMDVGEEPARFGGELVAAAELADAQWSL